MILYIYLKNVVGIYNGMDITEFELNFESNKTKFNLIFGSNGSGKSTLSNSLDPFATEKIRKGKKGEKRIIIKAGKNKYDIRHYYEPTKTGHSVKSYVTRITKEGVEQELNPNGNVTSFKDILELEIGISESSLKLLKLGRDLTSLISMTPTERKKYMTKFTDAAEIYLLMGKKVNDDIRILKKILDNTNHKLSNIGPLEELKQELEEADDTLKALNDEETRLSSEIAGLNVQAGLLMDNEKLDELRKLRFEINDLKYKRNKYKVNEEYSNLTIDGIKFRIDSLKNNINMNTLLLNNSIIPNIELLQKELINVKDERYLIEDKIDTLDDIDDDEDIDETINSFKRKNDSYKEQLAFYNKELKDISIFELKHVLQIFDDFNRDVTSITDQLELDDLLAFNINDDYNDIGRKLNMELTSLQSHYNILCTNESSLQYLIKLNDTLNKRPKDCKIDTCPFILDAMNNIGEIHKLDKIIKEKEMVEKDIDIINNKIEIVWSLNKLSTLIINLDKAMNSVNDTIRTSSNYSLEKIIKCVMRNSFNYINKDNILHMISIIEISKECEKRNEMISELLDKKKRIDELNELCVKLYEINKKIADIKSKMETYDLQKEDISQSINNFNTEIELLTDYMNCKSSIDKLDDKINRCEILENSFSHYNKLMDAIEDIQNNELPKIEDMKKANILYRDKLVSKISEGKKLKKYKKLIVDNYKDVDMLRAALSTKEGIPLLFVSLILSQTRKIANEILIETFDNTIKLGKFVINDKEFNIPLIGKGDGSEDVSKASAGERAIISLALSLALFKQQGKTNYNTLILDELDGPLDDKRRRGFLRLLDTRTDKLKIKQVFTISHNDMFDEYKANLILLKGANTDNLKDKHILFEY